MAEGSDDSADESSVEVGPVKLRIERDKSLVLVTTKSGSANCHIRVFQCLTVPSLVAAPFCLRPPEDAKKGPLLYDFIITPSTVINLDKFECNHGKPKLAVLFYQRDDDVGGSAHKELVFKEQSWSSGDYITELEQLLLKGPYRDMHPFDVDIAPHQSIPDGPVKLAIFPTHISVAKRYKLKKQKDTDKEGPGQIATIKRKMRELPMVVRLKDLDNFSTLPLGLRFEVSQQCYFFCCNEGGEEMNSLIGTFRHKNILPNSEMAVLPGVGKTLKVQHPHLRRLKSHESGLGAKQAQKHPPLQRQVSAPAIVFEMVEESDAVSNEAPPLPDRTPPSPPPPNTGPPLPPKTRSRCNTVDGSFASANEVGTTNHYANEWAARRCTEVLQGGIKLNVGVFARKPQLGRTWIMHVVIYRQGVPLKDVKEYFPSMDIVCPPRAFQVVQHVSINVEVPDGWNTDEIVKEIEMERLGELTDQYIYEVCIEHENTDEKQFHGRIYIRQGVTETLTLNIITNFSLYERVGQKRTGEPLYDLVPATREPKVKGQQGLLQQFSVRLQFCNNLDALNIFGNDFRLLAEKIGLDYQAILAIETRSHRTGQSPTELVLREWETGQSAVPFRQQELVSILRDMGRLDVILDLALPVPKLKDVKVAATTANTIRVTWDLDTPDVTECTIEAKPVGSDCRTFADHVQNNGNRTFLLKDLEPGTEYLIQVVPSFQRVAGEMVELRAKTNVPKLKDVKVAGTTANTIRITWDLDTPDVTECTIKAKPVGSNRWTFADHVQNNSNRAFLLQDLEPGTEYLIHVVPSFQRVPGEMVEVRARTDAVLEEEVNIDGEDLQGRVDGELMEVRARTDAAPGDAPGVTSVDDPDEALGDDPGVSSGDDPSETTGDAPNVTPGDASSVTSSDALGVSSGDAPVVTSDDALSVTSSDALSGTPGHVPGEIPGDPLSMK